MGPAPYLNGIEMLISVLQGNLISMDVKTFDEYGRWFPMVFPMVKKLGIKLQGAGIKECRLQLFNIKNQSFCCFFFTVLNRALFLTGQQL